MHPYLIDYVQRLPQPRCKALDEPKPYNNPETRYSDLAIGQLWHLGNLYSADKTNGKETPLSLLRRDELVLDDLGCRSSLPSTSFFLYLQSTDELVAGCEVENLSCTRVGTTQPHIARIDNLARERFSYLGAFFQQYVISVALSLGFKTLTVTAMPDTREDMLGTYIFHTKMGYVLDERERWEDNNRTLFDKEITEAEKENRSPIFSLALDRYSADMVVAKEIMEVWKARVEWNAMVAS